MKNTGGIDVSDVLDSSDDEDDDSSLFLNVSAVRAPPQQHDYNHSRNATQELDDIGLSGDLLGLVLDDIEDQLRL